MKNNRRPIFRAWEDLMLEQITSSENAIVSLTSELRAHRILLKAKKQTLIRARKDEAKIKS